MSETDTQHAPAINPVQALHELVAGNRRYALGAGIHPNQTLNRRDEILSGQHPFAIIIGCSDSRVPPEIVFDCGLGDLFVIRTAGHAMDDAAIASVQYGVEHLGVELILVLGHSECGALKSAISGGKVSEPLGVVLGKLQPAVAAASGRMGDLLENAVIENIRMTIARLKEMKWTAPTVIHGAYMNLKSGLVTLDPGT
jgi:carbonic anhydrase